MRSIEKVAVIGLDCADPVLMFEQWVDQLPNVQRLMAAGTYGNLTSCVPPITVPAWSCMAASLDPGRLGVYGFRNRADYSYDKLSIATSLAIKEPRLWEMLAAHGKQSTIVGFPGTFPIVRPVRGHMVTCFLTPDTNDPKVTWTHPPTLRKEINALVGEYIVDVKNFRTDDKEWLLGQIHTMSDKLFTVVRYLMNQKPWDLLWFVDMGVDRMHHGFWSFMDHSHHRYEPGSPFEHAIRNYYIRIDGQIGRLLECMDLDKTAVWIVSDHGCKGMVGGCMFNQWLINEGYLHFKAPVQPRQKFNVADVDWSKTTAWGEGGYYGRLFINVEGREPNGQVKRSDYERFRTELIKRIEAIKDHEGNLMGNKCYRPEDVYEQVNGIPPDLIVIFGDLRWRSVGTVGSDRIHTFENDTGPDDANHAQQGMYLYAHPSLPPRGRVDGPTLYDVAPTILTQFGLPVPGPMKGRSLV